jgi:hypothetical protein
MFRCRCRVIQRELTKDNTWRSYSTKKAYGAYLRRWIIPHWGTAPLSEVRTMGVESWLRRLPLAKSSCAKMGLQALLAENGVPVAGVQKTTIRTFMVNGEEENEGLHPHI